MKFIYKKFLSQTVSVLVLIAMLLPVGIVPVYAAPGDTTRVSIVSSGVQGNGMSRFASVSADGRFVVFESDANNLVTGDTNGVGDIFIYDRQTAQTSRVSLDSAGTQANNGSWGASVSADGRFVAFSSDATNLVSGDTNGFTDVFVRDRQAGTTKRISISSSGEQANNISDAITSISSDGRLVAFESNATNLAPDDTNGVTDIFVHDIQTGVTERISRTSDGAGANGLSFDPSISADGSTVVFSSNATNLDGNDTNNKTDVFVRTRSNGQTTRASVNSGGLGGNQGGVEASISGDGRYVTFSSSSTDLVTPEPLANKSLYIRDRQTGTTTLASVFSNGSEMVGWAEQSFISNNGRYIAFEFDDKGDGLPIRWIYVRDLVLGQTIRATARPEEETAPPAIPALSTDGSILVFHSSSSNLVSGDTNGTYDVFAYEVSFAVDAPPTVLSIQASCGASCPPAAQTISFNVAFSESVTGVSADDFALNVTGTVSGASVIDVSGSGNTYTVNVNTATGDGTLRLDLTDNDSIQDAALNPLGGAGVGNGNFNTGQPYNLDKSLPSVLSILRTDPNPTTADLVHYTVTFSESVNGVDVSDFTLSTIGSLSNVSVTEVLGSGDVYAVTVNTGTGDGGLHIDLIDNDSITDTAANPLGGAGAGNGNFTLGDSYSVDKNPPTVLSILRADANPTSATTVRFTVTFSEAVIGVDVSDFSVNTAGITGASVTEISRADNIYTVTVNTGNNNGTLRLDVIDNDSITDSANRPLGGVGTGNGNFIAGEVYTINKVVIVTTVTAFRSTGANDGWVVESNENSNVGGSKNSASPVFKLGDDAQDRQIRAILHFPTYYLPDNAVVTRVILTIKRQDVIGTDPFATHQNISIDIRKGYFSTFNLFSFFSLQATDFQAPADVYSVGTIQNNPVNNWYWAMLDDRALPLINLTDITQLRLGFQLDDNDDLSDDHIRFLSGDYVEQRDRPHLQIEYYVPK